MTSPLWKPWKVWKESVAHSFASLLCPFFPSPPSLLSAFSLCPLLFNKLFPSLFHLVDIFSLLFFLFFAVGERGELVCSFFSFLCFFLLLNSARTRNFPVSKPCPSCSPGPNCIACPLGFRGESPRWRERWVLPVRNVAKEKMEKRRATRRAGTALRNS